MDIFALVLMSLIYLAELIFAFFEIERFRKIFKPLCLLALIFYLSMMKLDNIYIYGALFFGWIGDIFLLFKKERKLLVLIGILSFLVGHIFYIITFVNLLSYDIPVIAIIITIALGLLSPLVPYKICYRNTKFFTAPGGFYGYVLFVELIVAILLAIDQKTMYSNLILAGNMLFITSDIVLTVSMFFKDFKRRDFYIMGTYLAAQTLMSIGLFFMIK